MAEDGFLSRWSRRKALVKQGVTPPPEPPVAPPPALAVPTLPVAAEPALAEPEAPTEPAPPPPTLEDVAALGRESDFSRFMKPDVDPGVKNAAMKKLFADPHFNVMDGLDIYIDDYGKPDPLPPGMLRQLAQSQFLGLFADKPEQPPNDGAGAQPPAVPMTTAEGAAPAPAEPTLPAADAPASEPSAEHENPDLRLQPDDAAGRRGPGEGAA